MISILMSNMALDKKWGRLDFQEYINPSDKAVILAFPFFNRAVESAEDWNVYFGCPDGIFYDYFTEPLAFFGISPKNIRWINYFTDTPETARAKIKNADIIIISDGVPRQMLQIIDNLNLRDMLKDYRKLLIGASHGAVIQLADYQVEPCSLWDFQYFNGLGMIDNIGIEIGFDEFDFPNMSLRKFLEEKKKPIYALHDEGAVIWDNGKTKTVGDVDVISSVAELDEGIKATQTLREHLQILRENRSE